MQRGECMFRVDPKAGAEPGWGFEFKDNSKLRMRSTGTTDRFRTKL